jgi:MFS family permease
MQYSSKKDFIILLGNVIDHFDTSIYLFLAPVMAPLFFPHSDPVIALIMAYGILATSIVARPVGTYIFGMITNNSGPSKALSYSLIGVGTATLVVSILPDYHTIGIAAPILLIIFRIFREIFAAGESAIAKLYILQDKPEKEAFKSSYLYQTSTIFGIILASVASTFVHYLDIANSWRIVFFLGGFAAIIGYIFTQKFCRST